MLHQRMVWKAYNFDRREVLFAIISLSIAFKICWSESTTAFFCPNVQLSRNRGVTGALGRQRFSTHPLARFSRRRQLTMDFSDELRRLDAVSGNAQDGLCFCSTLADGFAMFFVPLVRRYASFAERVRATRGSS